MSTAIAFMQQIRQIAPKFYPWLMLLGVTLLAWYSASAFWAFYQFKQPNEVSGPVLSSESYAYKLSNMVLFDQAISGPTASASSVDFNNLLLALEGVFVNKGNLSAALIRSNNISKKYRVGQIIEGTTVQLQEVRWNEVVLASSDNLNRATLKLGETQAKPIDSAPQVATNSIGSVPAAVGLQALASSNLGFANNEQDQRRQNITSTLQQFSQMFVSNPKETMASVGVQSSAKGYVVTDGASSFVKEMGILPGDTVVSVNGQPVGPDLRKDQKLLQEVTNSKQANIRIVRGGQSLTLNQSW